MKKSNLSIIVPCYNCSAHCEPLLRSVAAQKTTYSFEVICIIDNTTDNSYELIDSFLTSHSIPHRMKISSNGSTGLSRNDGIELAQSDYIMFIDDDDWFLGEDVFQSALDFAYANSQNPICKFDFEWNEGRDELFFIWRYIWKTDFLKENRFQDKMGGEDVQMMMDIYRKYRWDACVEGTYPHLNKTLYHYNFPRDGSILGRIKAGKIIRRNGEVIILDK